MARLTEARFQKAKPILDRYREQFHRTRHLNTTLFEKDLKEIWGLHYQELKTVMIDLSRRPEYLYLAARYMEGGSPGVVSEFQSPLAALYGLRYYHAPDREERQREFWKRAFTLDPAEQAQEAE